jgi:hypothetical protein
MKTSSGNRNFAIVTLWVALGVAGQSFAKDKAAEARAVVDSIRLADPPQVSTSAKSSPVGQPVSDYKPTGPSSSNHEPPAPVDRKNPRNDPDVRRGYEQHQKEHGR